ncbi:MAG: hypothetical protein KIT33_10105 [Candidatus Kapabacteria bacterium]|nr:hypothetical protein [Candidatus Kapabacteria bacterium]
MQISNNSEYIGVVKSAEYASVPPQNISYIPSLSYSSADSVAITGEGNVVFFSGKVSGDFNIINLKPDQIYDFILYKKEKNSFKKIFEVSHTTLAEMPERQAQKIMWSNQTHNSIDIYARAGSGEKTLFTVSRSPNDFIPSNASEYTANSTFGQGFEPSSGVFVVYSGNDNEKSVKVSGLEPGTYYYVTSYEFNGKGKSTHYNPQVTKLANAARIATTLETPKNVKVQKKAESQKGGSQKIVVEWEKVKSASTYIIELALDEDFVEPEEIYGTIDVGELSAFEFDELEQKRTYYIRIKSANQYFESNYSEVFIVNL